MSLYLPCLFTLGFLSLCVGRWPRQRWISRNNRDIKVQGMIGKECSQELCWPRFLDQLSKKIFSLSCFLPHRDLLSSFVNPHFSLHLFFPLSNGQPPRWVDFSRRLTERKQGMTIALSLYSVHLSSHGFIIGSKRCASLLKTSIDCLSALQVPSNLCVCYEIIPAWGRCNNMCAHSCVSGACMCCVTLYRATVHVIFPAVKQSNLWNVQIVIHHGRDSG